MLICLVNMATSEVLLRSFADLAERQSAFNRWRPIYNQHRPPEVLATNAFAAPTQRCDGGAMAG